MKFLIVVTLALSAIISPLAQAQMKCAEILKDSGLVLSTKGFEADRQNNKSEIADQTVRLLQMIASTRDEAFSKKMTQEKGELLLGERLEKGYSLEYEYFADRRGIDEIFRLGAISLVKPNGEKAALLKKSTSEDGRDFIKSRLTEEEMGLDGLGEASPFANLKELSAPTLIQGGLLKSLMKWAPRAEFLSRKDLNALNSSKDLRLLRGKTMARSTYDYGKNVVKKQSFKFLILAAAIYIYSNEGDRVQDALASFQDPWASIEIQTNLADVKTVLPVLQFGTLPQMKPTPMVSLKKALKNVNILINHEKDLGGKPRVFTLNGIKPKELNLKRVVKSIQDAAENGDHVVILHLPATKRMLFVQGDDEDSSRMQVLGLSEQMYPAVYEQLKNLLKD